MWKKILSHNCICGKNFKTFKKKSQRVAVFNYDKTFHLHIPRILTEVCNFIFFTSLHDVPRMQMELPGSYRTSIVCFARSFVRLQAVKTVLFGICTPMHEILENTQRFCISCVFLKISTSCFNYLSLYGNLKIYRYIKRYMKYSFIHG